MEILFFATQSNVLWNAGHNMAHEILQFGQKVYAIYPKGNDIKYICQNGSIEYTSAKEMSVVDMAHLFKQLKSLPDIIIPLDDLAVSYLRDIYNLNPKSELAGLIYKMLGSFLIKDESDISRLNTIKSFVGNAIPNYIFVDSCEDLSMIENQIRFPIIYKRMPGWGGLSVKKFQSSEELIAYAKKTVNFFPGICQEFIVGKEIGCVVSGHLGQPTGHFCFERIESVWKFGPASVVKPIYSESISLLSIDLFAKLKLNGFVNIDYILSRDLKPSLLEINYRPHPVTHLGKYWGMDVVFPWINKVNFFSTPLSDENQKQYFKIALFPNEYLRNKKSPHFNDGYHDLPHHIFDSLNAKKIPE